MPFVKYCLLCKEELKIFRKPKQSVDFTVTGPEIYSKQAGAELGQAELKLGFDLVFIL